MMANKDIKSIIKRSYKLKDIVQVHRSVESGHKKGNVIISIDQGV